MDFYQLKWARDPYLCSSSMYRKLRFLKTASRHRWAWDLEPLSLGHIASHSDFLQFDDMPRFGCPHFLCQKLGLTVLQRTSILLSVQGHSGKYLWIPSSVLYRVFQYFMGYDIRRCDIEQILKIVFLGEYRCFALTNSFWSQVELYSYFSPASSLVSERGAGFLAFIRLFSSMKVGDSQLDWKEGSVAWIKPHNLGNLSTLKHLLSSLVSLTAFSDCSIFRGKKKKTKTGHSCPFRYQTIESMCEPLS